MKGKIILIQSTFRRCVHAVSHLVLAEAKTGDEFLAIEKDWVYHVITTDHHVYSRSFCMNHPLAVVRCCGCI